MSTSYEHPGSQSGIPAPMTSPKEIEIQNLPRCCTATTIGLTVAPDATEAQIVTAVEVIEGRGKGHQWQLGDALVELKSRFPERGAMMLSEEMDKIRENYGQASRVKAKQIADRFPMWTRVHSLSWSHHRAAAFFESLDERVRWIHLARDNNWSVHELEKEIRAATAEPAEPTNPDLYVLKEEAVRAYLDSDIERQRSQLSEVPESAGFLRDLQYERIEAAKWQLARTVERDLDAVREAVSELMGTWQQIFYWLKARQRIISPPDVRIYLGMLKDAGRITEEHDEKPNEDASGTTVTVYKPKRNDHDDKQDSKLKKSALDVP